MKKLIVFLTILIVIISSIFWFLYTNDIVVEGATIQTYANSERKLLYGIVRNKGNKNYRHVHVNFDLFDEAGNNLGNMIVTVKEVGPKEEVNFEEVFFRKNAVNLKITKIDKIPITRSEAVSGIYRSKNEISIVKGEVKITFIHDGTSLSSLYRVVAWNEDPKPPFDFIPILLTAIPFDKMPDDRPFIKKDLASAISIFLIPPNLKLIEKMRMIINDKEMLTRYGFQKLRISGNSLKLKDFFYKGNKMKFQNNTLFIDLEDIEALYGQIEKQSEIKVKI